MGGPRRDDGLRRRMSGPAWQALSGLEPEGPGRDADRGGPPDPRPDRRPRRRASLALRHGPRRCDCVELIRVVENRGFGRPRRAGVVVRPDRVQQLRANARLERTGPLLDQPQAEVHVAEQPPLFGRAERRPTGELDGSADVVQDRGREQQVGPEPGMQLRDLAADRRDSNRVLEQAARVAVVALDRGGQRAQPAAQLFVTDEPPDCGLQPGMRDLTREELEEALQLVAVSPQARGECGRVEVFRSLERPDLELQPVAVAIHAAEHPDRVAFVEAAVQKVDVAPDARLDAPARVDELQREIRRAGARAQPLLLRDRVHAFDDPVVLQLGDRRHDPSLGPKTDATVLALWPRSSRFGRFATTPAAPAGSTISSRLPTT